MYHNPFLSGKRSTLMAVGALTFAASLSAAHAASEPIKCRQAIVSASAKYQQARTGALKKCEDGIRKGKFNVCPDDDAKTLDKLAGLQSKLDAAVAKACCGDDKTCGAGSGEDADLALSAIGWSGRSLACVGGERNGQACKVAADCPGVCPDGLREGEGCQPGISGICTVGCRGTCSGGPTPGLLCSADAGCGSGGTCVTKVCYGGTNDGLSCTADSGCTGSVSCVAATGCGPATADVCPDLEGKSCDDTLADPSDVSACLSCVGDVASDQMIDFIYGFLNPVSDAPEGAEKCRTTIAKAGAKYFSTLSKGYSKCEKAAIGDSLPAGTCPDADTSAKLAAARVKMQDAIIGKCAGADEAFGGSDDFVVEAVGAPLSCEAITIPGGASCADFINSVEDVDTCLACLAEYKTVCSDTLAAPSNGTVAAGCNQDCGNAKLDSGETCDDGNARDGDACPSNCNISSCTDTGNATAQVTFTVPAGASVAGLTVFIDYPEAKVQVKGQGNTAQVQAQFSNTPANTTFLPNELDYAVRVVLTENDNAAIGAGSLFDLALDKCNSAALPATSEFNCRVESATDGSAAVFGATCAVAAVF